MSVTFSDKKTGIKYGDNKAFYGLVTIDDSNMRVGADLVPFLTFEIESAKLSTTDDTSTEIASIEIPEYTTKMIEAKIVGRRTGGDAGTDEDGLAYVMTAAFKNVAGAATQIGSTVYHFNEKDQPAWDCIFTTDSGNVKIEVAGAVDNNIDWLCYTKSHFITQIIDIPPP